MQYQLMTMLIQYHLVIMIAVLALLLFLSRRKTGNSRFLLIITVTLGLAILYEVIMDEPASRMPGRINRALNQHSDTSKSSNPHYYVPPDERYNLPANE